MEKLEWLGYPTVKNFEDIFIRFDATHERDTHTHRDRQTDTAWRHRPRLCIASRGKNGHPLSRLSRHYRERRKVKYVDRGKRVRYHFICHKIKHHVVRSLLASSVCCQLSRLSVVCNVNTLYTVYSDSWIFPQYLCTIYYNLQISGSVVKKTARRYPRPFFYRPLGVVMYGPVWKIAIFDLHRANDTRYGQITTEDK